MHLINQPVAAPETHTFVQRDEEDPMQIDANNVSYFPLKKTNNLLPQVQSPFTQLPAFIKSQILLSKNLINNQQNCLFYRALNRKYNQKIKQQINEIRPQHIDVYTLNNIRLNFNNITKVDLRRPFEQQNFENNEFEEGALEALMQFEKLQIVYLPKEVVVRQFFKRRSCKKNWKVECTVKGNIPEVVIHELLRIWMKHNSLRKL
eukprot:TRINITY_DN2271_c0_g1_i1.p2 TRINITY_DN2271_c0_g1~~TRINITY_DN2271_c0_g1_i1.p2  ORF type:complete len:205 (+),score=15.71 TRINITY_DN2271_c0_g1_i1:154-768(+)